MPPSRDSLLDDRPPGWPAWSVSLVIHLGLLATATHWLQSSTVQPSAVQGAADQPTREVGIALKRITDDGPQFEEEGVDEKEVDEKGVDEEASQPSESRVVESAVASPSEPFLGALPSSQEFPSSAADLPRLPTFGSSVSPSSANPSSVVGSNTSAEALQGMATGGPPSRSIGSKATVSLFGIAGTGTRFVYVFDRSSSMVGAPLRVAKRQLIASLDALDSVHQFQIIFFNHEPQSWDLTGGQNRIAFASAANKRQAKKFVRGVSATGGTFRRTALQLAIRLQPDVIFFLTDTDDPMAQVDLKEAIRRDRYQHHRIRQR